MLTVQQWAEQGPTGLGCRLSSVHLYQVGREDDGRGWYEYFGTCIRRTKMVMMGELGPGPGGRSHGISKQGRKMGKQDRIGRGGGERSQQNSSRNPAMMKGPCCLAWLATG